MHISWNWKWGQDSNLCSPEWDGNVLSTISTAKSVTYPFEPQRAVLVANLFPMVPYVSAKTFSKRPFHKKKKKKKTQYHNYLLRFGFFEQLTGATDLLNT